MLGALAMFMYVGVEVIAGDTIISYGAIAECNLNGQLRPMAKHILP